MYIPACFRERDQQRLLDFMRQHSFAQLSISAGKRIECVHLPLLWRPLDRTLQPHGEGVLVGHVARANPIWQAFDGRREALAVFSGPHAYVSPRWYSSRPQVPTWNYCTVHAYGAPRVLEDTDWAMQLLSETVDKYETWLAGGTAAGDAEHEPWRMDEEPEYTQRLLAGIVAFEMPLSELQGKFKLNQNKSAADRAGVAAGLEKQGDEAARAVAELMRLNQAE